MVSPKLTHHSPLVKSEIWIFVIIVVASSIQPYSFSLSISPHPTHTNTDTMKLATASALILAICGSTSAFSAAPSVNGASTALRATATETYTFTKSEEIFAEAKTVSYVCSSTRRAQYYYFLHAIAFNLLRSVDRGCVDVFKFYSRYARHTYPQIMYFLTIRLTANNFSHNYSHS